MNPFSAEFLAQFHFLRPLFLLALVPAVLLILLLRYLRSMQSSWQQAVDPRLLPYLLDRSASPQQSWPLYGLLVLWILGVIALAGPVWEQQPVPVQEREDSLVLVLDLSLSMYAQDQRPGGPVRALFLRIHRPRQVPYQHQGLLALPSRHRLLFQDRPGQRDDPQYSLAQHARPPTASPHAGAATTQI